MFHINILEDTCTGLRKEEKSYKVIDTLKTLGLDGYWFENIEEEFEIYCLYENELNLSASYAFSESLATSLLYVNVDTETSANDEPDYDKWIATIEYTF